MNQGFEGKSCPMSLVLEEFRCPYHRGKCSPLICFPLDCVIDSSVKTEITKATNRLVRNGYKHKADLTTGTELFDIFTNQFWSLSTLRSGK